MIIYADAVERNVLDVVGKRSPGSEVWPLWIGCGWALALGAINEIRVCAYQPAAAFPATIWSAGKNDRIALRN